MVTEARVYRWILRLEDFSSDGSLRFADNRDVDTRVTHQLNSRDSIRKPLDCEKFYRIN